MSRTRVCVLLTSMVLLVAACAPAHAASIVGVRPAITPQDAAALRAKGLPVDADVLTPAQLAERDLRARRARAFPHQLAPAGFDWSAKGRGGAERAARRARVIAGRAAADAATALGPPDTIRVAFVRIDFATDRGGDASSGDGRFDLTPIDTTAVPIDRPPHNRTFYQRHADALARYYDAQTYGRVVLSIDVWPRSEDGAYTTTDMADYGPWAFSPDIYRAAVDMFRGFLFAADTQSTALGDRIPWDTYDHVVLIHAGSDLQNDLRQDSKEDIPSFTIGVDDTDRVVFRDSLNVPIDHATFIPETINQDGYYGAINGVLAHECGHLMFNFFDVYDIATGYPVVGYWSLMDSGNLLGVSVKLTDGTKLYATGLLPPSIDPWQRAFTTPAITLDEMGAQGDVTPFRDSERHPDIRRLTLTADEYLLFENRYVAPVDSLRLDQDEQTRVVLGPKSPDRYAYDGLLAGGGMLVWHVDQSVIPLEYAFPLDTALRVNPDFGLNTNYYRHGLSVLEADGLADLGDPSSPLWLGSDRDPWWVGNATALSDTTIPNLIPHIGTRPHLRVDVLDPRDSLMRVQVRRTWAMPGFPTAAAFAPGGPQLLAVDADGDGVLDLCWAGGTKAGGDSAGVFVMKPDGQGLYGVDPLLATLDRRPDPILAAYATGGLGTGGRTRGPALFAVVTRPAFPGDTVGGKVWLLDHTGSPLAGWPAVLPARVTTPPVFASVDLAGPSVFVGAEDGRVYQIAQNGAVAAVSPALGAPVTGRLAVLSEAVARPQDAPAAQGFRLACGTAEGEVVTLTGGLGTLDVAWRQLVAGSGFAPDFLWIDFGGVGAASAPPCANDPYTLVVRDAIRLYAYCAADGVALPGWGRAFPDTLVASLGGGDPDGDGYPEVLVQTRNSGVAFVNASGGPSPGWPKRTSSEDLVSGSPALAADVDGDGRSEVVTMDAAGALTALRADGKVTAGWPLATGAGASGAPVIADLDGDGFLELVAGDNVNGLWGYSLPASAGGAAALRTPWPMLGGDPGRTSALPPARTPVALAPTAGPLVRASLKAYPNPARRKPVTFGFTLTEPARCEFRVLDTSGHEVAAFTRDGRQAENLVTWEPGALPAGLYLVDIRFRGARDEHHETLQVGLLR